MQRLFDFTPSDIKPLSEFFASEQCDIIRKLSGRGYFVVTREVITMGVPTPVRRMWWVIKHPTECKRLSGRDYCYFAVSGGIPPVNLLK